VKTAHVAPILLSIILPGTGHIAIGKALKGLLIFFCFGFAVDGWVYSQAASVLPPENSVLSIPALHRGSIALGGLIWAFATFDMVHLALRRRRLLAKAAVADGHIRDALVAHLRNDSEAALKELHAARRINDRDPDALFHLGVLYASRGERRKARRALLRCIRYDQEGKWDTHAQQQLRALEAPAPRSSAQAPAAGQEGSG